ncbi:SAM-dependent methyltransferase [Rhodospirillaceae bacterium LM-1]|nr:SAM-dependent methyltransferase [Rhodospirillaceae bacterium LM-1]
MAEGRMENNNRWLEYWNGDVSVYVSPRHLEAHYKGLFADITPLLPKPPFTLLDYGCGDALMAPDIASRGGRVLLYDRAAARRATLRNRFAGQPAIEILDDLKAAEGACDLALMISVIQYVPKAELPALLRSLKALLKPDGLLVIGDILSPDNSMVGDVSALLRFGMKEGFLADAMKGLVKTLRSDYRKMRGELGLSSYSISDIIGVLTECGFQAQPLTKNIGHAHHRRSVTARLK